MQAAREKAARAETDAAARHEAENAARATREQRAEAALETEVANAAPVDAAVNSAGMPAQEKSSGDTQAESAVANIEDALDKASDVAPIPEQKAARKFNWQWLWVVLLVVAVGWLWKKRKSNQKNDNSAADVWAGSPRMTGCLLKLAVSFFVH